MKFTIDKSELNYAVKSVTRAMGAKASMPILEGIYIAVSADNRALFKCTDLSMQIETIVDADVDEAGEIVMPGRLLSEVASKVSGTTVSFETSRNTISIVSDKTKAKMQGEDASGYPTMSATGSGAVSVKMNMYDLRNMIKQATVAVAQDDTKPILRGVLTESNANGIQMVSLDGYRLAMLRKSCTGGEGIKAVIPARSLIEISRTLTDSEDSVTLIITRTHVTVQIGNTKVTVRLLDGEFIRYEQILPKDHAVRVNINRAEMLEALERVGLFARDSKSNLVKFSFASDTLSISANSETGSAVEEVGANIIGNPIDIAFNAKFFTDILKVIDDEYIYIDMNTSTSPCVITPVDGQDYYYLILPVRMMQ